VSRRPLRRSSCVYALLGLAVAFTSAFGGAGAGAFADAASVHGASSHVPAKLTRASERRKCVHDAHYRSHHVRRCRALRRVGSGAPRQQPPTSPASAPAGVSTAVIAPGVPAAALIATSPPVVPPSSSSSESSEPIGSEEPGETSEPPIEPPAVPHVQVSAVEYAFSLSRTTVPAGKVIFQFVNDGQDEHNLKIAPPEEGPLAGSFSNEPAKGVANLELDMRPGSYTLFCSLPTHEQKGMKATLVVE
jgi:plastocyanin